mgnify:CR=1 FL=1
MRGKCIISNQAAWWSPPQAGAGPTSYRQHLGASRPSQARCSLLLQARDGSWNFEFSVTLETQLGSDSLTGEMWMVVLHDFELTRKYQQFWWWDNILQEWMNEKWSGFPRMMILKSVTTEMVMLILVTLFSQKITSVTADAAIVTNLESEDKLFKPGN